MKRSVTMLAVAGVTMAASTAALADVVVKIGFAGPLTGPISHVGKDEQFGATARQTVGQVPGGEVTRQGLADGNQDGQGQRKAEADGHGQMNAAPAAVARTGDLDHWQAVEHHGEENHGQGFDHDLGDCHIRCPHRQKEQTDAQPACAERGDQCDALAHHCCARCAKYGQGAACNAGPGQRARGWQACAVAAGKCGAEQGENRPHHRQQGDVLAPRAVLETAAGHVIEAFGVFMMQGNYVVGVIVFAILVIVNFIVITKGSGRIADVAARFSLDAMPGKQMAIDSDLSAGIITEEESKIKRADLQAESTFFGSMDGSSKFVRGDAIAGLLIVFINAIGGIIIGSVTEGLTLSEAAQTYTLLTIGDGLVTQVPALIVSVAAGLLVSKAGVEDTADEALVDQFGRYPRATAVRAALMLLISLMSGMPMARQAKR